LPADVVAVGAAVLLGVVVAAAASVLLGVADEPDVAVWLSVAVAEGLLTAVATVVDTPDLLEAVAVVVGVDEVDGWVACVVVVDVAVDGCTTGAPLVWVVVTGLIVACCTVCAVGSMLALLETTSTGTAAGVGTTVLTCNTGWATAGVWATLTVVTGADASSTTLLVVTGTWLIGTSVVCVFGWSTCTASVSTGLIVLVLTVVFV